MRCDNQPQCVFTAVSTIIDETICLHGRLTKLLNFGLWILYLPNLVDSTIGPTIYRKKKNEMKE